MKLNSKLLKTLSLLVLSTPVAFAGNCKEIKDYLSKLKKDENGDDVYYLETCNENSSGKVTELEIYDHNMATKDIEKILSYDSIKTFKYTIDFDAYKFEDEPEKKDDSRKKVNKLTNLKKLKNLENLYIHYSSEKPDGIGVNFYYYGQLEKNTLKDLKSLKSLELEGIELSQNNLEEISALTNLKTLKFSNMVFKKCKDYEPLNKLKNVKNLELQKSEVTSELVNAIKSVKELVVLDANNNIKFDLPNVEKITYDRTKDLTSLAKLKKLNELYLTFYGYSEYDLASLEKVNQLKKLTISVDRVIPGAAGITCEPIELKFSEENQLKELYINVAYPSESSVKEIRKLKHLEKFHAECKHYIDDKGAKILKDLESEFSSLSTETPSVKDRCGKDYGKCASGECCSKYGWCGKTDDHCSASKGCQSEFGKCTKDNEDNVNNEGKCGKGYGKCASGECCSKYGWCGKTDDHCSATKGCQSEFGKCTKDNENINNESKCGKGYGKCPSGECCSKYGWCGKTNDHCLASKGCQSEFGKCTKDNEDNINNEGKCGKGFGKCRSGECCSKFGWCGNTDDHCLASKGCQSEFGKCK